MLQFKTASLRNKLCLLVVALICALPKQIHAMQLTESLFTDPMDGAFDISKFLADYPYGVLLVPQIITEPAVDDGLGLIGLFFHETEEAKKKRQELARSAKNASKYMLPPNLTGVGYFKTGNESWFAGALHMAFWNEGKIRYIGFAGTADYNLDFYGTRQFLLNGPVEVNTEGSIFAQALKFKLGQSNWYLGPNMRYMEGDLSTPNLAQALPGWFPDRITNKLTEFFTREVVNTGMGISVDYDSRDNVFSPSEGIYYQMRYIWFRESFGGDLNYENYNIEGHHYFKPTDRFRVAGRVFYDAVQDSGILPPFAIPALRLRGVQAGRYQDEHVAVLEAEASYQLTFRHRLLGFAGIGKVASHFDDLDDASSQVSKGVGFRYLIARRYGFEVGLDYALGPDQNVWYIQAGSAW